ncbi:hypothetical protein OAK92_02220 [Crocinitomicaceae bacterium]|jgi:hypothetical protein|nr:hypothetical protein [Crocinitomicaceae bacterium]
MMRIINSILAVLICVLAHSQSMLPLVQDTNINACNHELSLSGVVDFQSTSIGKDITKSFIYGGFIDDAMKLSSSNRHDEINRFGIDLNTEVVYKNHKVNLFKDSLKGLLIKGGVFSFSSLIYSKDLFDMAFYGNDMFTGDTAYFTGSQFNSVSFQKIGIGWLNKKSKSSFSLNFIGVNNYLNGVINESYLYNSQDADSLEFLLSGEGMRSNNSSYYKGFGLAIDMDYRFKMKKNEKEFVHFQLVMRNLGFAYSFNTENYIANGVATVGSYQINDLINSESIFSNPEEVSEGLSDTIITKGSLVMLPAMFQFTKLVDYNSLNQFQGFFGFRGYLNNAYVPMLFGGLDFKAAKWCRFGAQASYGGFSQLRWGMYSSFNFKNFNLGIASENLFSKTGESILIKLSCAF